MAEFNDDALIDFSAYPALDNSTEDDDIFGTPSSEDGSGITPESEPYKEDPFLNDGENSIITSLLKERGIEDPSKIEVYDEEGNLSESNFYELSDEEKLAILSENAPEPDLSDSEIDTVNFLRENNITLEEYTQYLKNQAIEEYLANNSDTSYTVDQLSDADIYKYDLALKYPSLTEEELDYELEKESGNADLFQKKVQLLRDEYIALEQQEQQDLAQQSEYQQEEQYNALVDSMVEVAQNTEDFHNLELDDNDKEDVLSFILEKDMNGQSGFAKLLNNPQELFRLAWFSLKGEEAFETTHDYYKKEIDSVRKKGSTQPTRTVIKQTPSSSNDDPYGIWSK